MIWPHWIFLLIFSYTNTVNNSTVNQCYWLFSNENQVACFWKQGICNTLNCHKKWLMFSVKLMFCLEWRASVCIMIGGFSSLCCKEIFITLCVVGKDQLADSFPCVCVRKEVYGKWSRQELLWLLFWNKLHAIF